MLTNLSESHPKPRLTRRDFLKWGITGLGSVALTAACRGLSKLTPTPRGEPTQPAKTSAPPTPTPTDIPTKEPTPTPKPTSTPKPTATEKPKPSPAPTLTEEEKRNQRINNINYQGFSNEDTKLIKQGFASIFNHAPQINIDTVSPIQNYWSNQWERKYGIKLEDIIKRIPSNPVDQLSKVSVVYSGNGTYWIGDGKIQFGNYDLYPDFAPEVRREAVLYKEGLSLYIDQLIATTNTSSIPISGDDHEVMVENLSVWLEFKYFEANRSRMSDGDWQKLNSTYDFMKWATNPVHYW